MKSLWGAGFLAMSVVVLISGCTTSEGQTVMKNPAQAAPTSSAAPASSEPLACDDLADSAQVEQALQSPANPAAFPQVWLAKRGYAELTAYAVDAAGGITCAWVSDDDGPDSPWLQVAVLPDAPAAISPFLYGDGPTDETRTIGGRVVTAGCGDPGCGVIAIVNDTWVDIRLNIPGLGTTGTQLGSIDTIFANASPAISAVFTVIDRATPGQLAWPTTSTLTQDEQASLTTGTASCESYLPAARLGAVIGDPTVQWESWEEPAVLAGISDLASTRAGIVKCMATGTSLVLMDLAPGNAWIAGDIGTNPRESVTFEKILLPGQIDTEGTFSDCANRADGTCTAIFSIGSATIEVSGADRSLAVAEAITARAR